jgi:ligand-binding sensor domain-containing protein
MRMADAEQLLDGPADRIVSGEREAVWVVGGTRCARFAAGRWRVFPADSFAGEAVRDVAPTPRGAIVATSGGLWEISGDDPRRLQFTVVRGRGLGGDREPRSVAVDAAGRCYVGTSAGVLAVGGEHARWHGGEAGLGEAVADVFVDSNRHLWIGFERDGVARVPLESLW